MRDTGSAPPPDLSDLAAGSGSRSSRCSARCRRSAAATAAARGERRAGSAPESRTQIFELLARTLTRLAGGRPLVLVMEDLHAADISLEALDYIVRRLGAAPILIVGTYRSRKSPRAIRSTG